MGKFKVGDKVTALSNWGGVTIGQEYEVESEASQTASGGWIMLKGVRHRATYDGSFREKDFTFVSAAKWQPKVGDRVKVTYAHGWNGVGTVTSVDGSINVVNMETGDHSGCTGRFESCLLQPATIKIEAGKFYRTRDGRKVGPMVASNSRWPFKTNGHNGAYYNADGSCPYFSNLDLIAEWIDEPITKTVAKPHVAAQVDAIAEEYGPVTTAQGPKFKAGDKVRFTAKCERGWWFGPHTRRLEGAVISHPVWPGYKYSVQIGEGIGYINDEHAELASPTAANAIVCLIKNGQPKPAAIPHVHDTVEAARVEATRLANKYKGDKFGVYVLNGEPAFVEKTYIHEWQRQAVNGNKIGAIRELRERTGIGLGSAGMAVEDFLDTARAA